MLTHPDHAGVWGASGRSGHMDPPCHGDAPHFNGMLLEEVSKYLGHSSTDVTRRYARHTPETLGAQAADALARAGVWAG